MAAQKTQRLTQEDKSAWRDILGAPDAGHSALVILMTALQMLIVPFSDNEPLALFYAFCTLGFFYLLRRSVLALLPVALPVGFLYLMGDPTLAAGALSLIFGGALGGYVLLYHHSKPKHLLLLLIPLATWGLTFLVTGDPMRGLLTLLPLAAAPVLALRLWHCGRASDTTLLGAASVALALVLALVLTLAATGGLQGNALAQLSDTLREGIAELLRSARDLYESTELAGTTADGVYAMTDAEIANTASMTVNLLPATFLILSTAVSYLAYRVFLNTVVTFGELRRIPRHVLTMTVSVPSAILFLAAFLLSLLVGNDHATLFGVFLQNFYLTLSPGLVLVGFSSLVGRSAPASCLSKFLLIGFIFILFTNIGTGLALVACYGAVAVLLARFFPVPDEKGGH